MSQPAPANSNKPRLPVNAANPPSSPTVARSGPCSLRMMSRSARYTSLPISVACLNVFAFVKTSWVFWKLSATFSARS